jgi:hypothetical protein
MSRASRQTWNEVHGWEIPKPDEVADRQVRLIVEGDERVLIIERRDR